MRVFASTTAIGPGRTAVAEVLAALDGLALDGIELGSTHHWQPDMAERVLDVTGRDERSATLFTHNYFPPAEHDFVVNIAAADETIRTASVAHAKRCLAMARTIGAEVYTVHPGFLAEDADPAETPDGGAFDFEFRGRRSPHPQAFARMIDSLREIITEAERLGVALAVETEGSIAKRDVLLLEQPEEFDALFEAIPHGLWMNFNLAHTALAARVHGFSVAEFIARFAPRFKAVELSHNDGSGDQHRPLEPDSWVLEWIPALPDVPLILEFREATRADIERSIALLRTAGEDRKLRSAG